MELGANTTPMKIYFVETEESERDLFADAFKEHDVYFVSELRDVESDAEVLSIFMHSIIDARFLDLLPKIKLIATRATSHDQIEISEYEKRGIVVSFVPSYGDNTVAEHTFALILALSRRTREAREASKAGKFSYQSTRGFDLTGKTLGVVGTGKIGLRLIRFAKAFEMNVIACDILEQSHLQEVLGFRYVPLDELLERSHIISLHVPLAPATYHLLNREAFSKCRRGVLIINTARGRLVDTDALIEALDQGLVAGAGLDVIEEERVMVRQWARVAADQIIEHIQSSGAQEEPRIGRPGRVAELQALMHNAELIGRPNVVFTPHIAFNSIEAVERINRTTIENINAFLAGRPVNVVGKTHPTEPPADNRVSVISTRAHAA
jgi:D-lactate dehydrogenase